MIKKVYSDKIVTLKAFCGSFFCTGCRDGTRSLKEKVEVKFSDDFCPDCGHALVWEKETTRKKKRRW